MNHTCRGCRFGWVPQAVRVWSAESRPREKSSLLGHSIRTATLAWQPSASQVGSKVLALAKSVGAARTLSWGSGGKRWAPQLHRSGRRRPMLGSCWDGWQFRGAVLPRVTIRTLSSTASARDCGCSEGHEHGPSGWNAAVACGPGHSEQSFRVCHPRRAFRALISRRWWECHGQSFVETFPHAFDIGRKES